MNNFNKAIAYVLKVKAANILGVDNSSDDVINDASNIFSNSYKDYCELYAALEAYFKA